MPPPGASAADATDALPGAPRDVMATLSSGGVDLTWREPSTGPVRRYAIAGGRTPGESMLPVQVTRDGALSARIDGLPPTTYSLRVYAIGTAGLGPPSTDVIFTVPDLGGPVLAPPFGLRVIAQTGRRVTVAWEVPVVGTATSMRVDADATLETLAPLTTLVERQFTSDLHAPVWVQVRALNGPTTSAPTQPLHVTFDAPCTAPPGRRSCCRRRSWRASRTFAWLPADGREGLTLSRRDHTAPGARADLRDVRRIESRPAGVPRVVPRRACLCDQRLRRNGQPVTEGRHGRMMRRP